MDEEYKKSSNYINNLYVSDEFFKKNLISPECYVIYDRFISDVKSGLSKGKISYDKSCFGIFSIVYESIYLDHPEFIAFQSARGKSYEEHSEITYAHLNTLQTYFGTRRIEREIDIIKRETKNMSDKEKIIFVYNYVASHNYDKLFTAAKSNQSAYSFFTGGSSVCAGFAKASQILLQNVGINSMLALDSQHMWNYVEYDKKWYIFDATYGSSFRDKSSKYYYEGLGDTTTGVIDHYFPELYPKIEETTLKSLFDLK